MKMLNDNGVISDELKTIIDNTKDLIFVKNKDFVYIAASPNFATNCVRVNGVENVIGKTDFELFEDRDIARKYREDDEKLLASGNAMREFREELPDLNGKKHLCLTTKYLLHDIDGNPVAIFGQYHDIGEQVELEIARRGKINKNIADALSRPFFAANYADLKTHKYIVIRATDYSGKMLEDCDTIEKAFEAFIKTLVKPEYQDKMREFCDSTTIASRLKNKNHINCEYLSNVALGWCTAVFFPCEWDENGEVSHVLFTVSLIDENIAHEIEEGIVVKENLKTIFDEVPGGIVLYEWTGKELKVLKMSRYYTDKYGYSMLNDSNEPDFMRIHPDDVDEYKNAIMEALTVTHQLEYIFRVWNKEERRYDWTQINAISKPQADGTSLVYAMYTDVTAQKETEVELAKKQASLEASLSISNQICCEYDPQLHKRECFTDVNFLNIPTSVYNYPECLRDINVIHPDDIELLINTVHSTDDGKHSAHCDVRAKKDGEYRWFSCIFEPYYDREKERNVVLFNIIDVTLRMASIQNYEARMSSMLSSKEDSLSMCTFNLTEDTFKMVGLTDAMKDLLDESASYEKVMLGITDSMLRETDKEKYRSLFCRENLLKMASEGTMHLETEYLLKFSESHYEWVTAGVDMVNNPINGETRGIAYSKSSQKQHMERAFLSKALTKDYVFAAIVFKDTDEFYIYNSEMNGFGDRMEHFWDVAFSLSNPNCSQETLDHMKEFYTKEKMFDYLEKNTEFTYYFDSMYTGDNTRLRAKFRYLDNERTTLLVTLRNFTDEELQEQWKYDSEHDALTGLYNRRMVFQESCRLLREYPQTQFAMVHCDVQHFHLYNTFFGEKAGDKLLRRMAEVIKGFEKDYNCFTCGRINSDTFCVFFPAERDIFENNIRYCFEELERFSPNFPIRLTIGVYEIEDRNMPAEEMFSRATIAAKSNKLNLFGLISKYDADLEKEMKSTQEIASEMNAAIENNQFEVYLQPKYSLRSEKLVGAEALVRWKHPEKGLISPGKFIPLFERNGFITELDCYMWEHVCRILRNWADEGKPMYPISVNISRVSMYSHATVPYLKSLIGKYGIDPEYLELELTESAYMDDPEDLKRMLKELQEFGFRILMDDFGSGYSSLNTLRELPVDVLKLDMKLLSIKENDVRGLAVLSSVVRMSKLLNIPIIAEGVEYQEQADYLRSIGCEFVQGFLFGQPMTVPEYEKLLVKGECAQLLRRVDSAPLASADVAMDDVLMSMGILEYKNKEFAYLRANKKFLMEFDLLENLNPASKVFREHLDDDNYDRLIQAFADCSESKQSIFLCIEWKTDNNATRKYHGYVYYHGNIGTYADLSVRFINVTEMKAYMPD